MLQRLGRAGGGRAGTALRPGPPGARPRTGMPPASTHRYPRPLPSPAPRAPPRARPRRCAALGPRRSEYQPWDSRLARRPLFLLAAQFMKLCTEPVSPPAGGMSGPEAGAGGGQFGDRLFHPCWQRDQTLELVPSFWCVFGARGLFLATWAGVISFRFTSCLRLGLLANQGPL
jgi:hypothetical protein